MEWMNGLELNEHFRDEQFRQSFTDLYALRTIYAHSILAPTYKPPEAMAGAVSLTEAGQELESRIHFENPALSAPELKTALFGIFAHRNIFVDVANTDASQLAALEGEEILRGAIKHPFAYGRELYDRFFDRYGSRRSDLQPEETQSFLDGTSQGVFQVGRYITGPHGLIESSAVRRHDPTSSAPLSHCTDPSCQALHGVTLRTGLTPIGRAYNLAQQRLRETEGIASTWSGFWNQIYMAELGYYDDFNTEDLPYFVGNALSDGEISLLLQALIEDYPTVLRTRFSAIGQSDKSLQGPSGAIVAGMGRAQCLQLILLASDHEIICSLERLIDTGSLKIPATEVRSSSFGRRGRGGAFRQTAECSSLGLRFVSSRSNLAIPRLNELIRRLYAGDDGLAELQWRLVDTPGENLMTRLDRLVHEADPQRIIQDFVISRPPLFDGMVRYLRYGRFAAPNSQEDRQRLIGRILWKLGYEVPVYPLENATLWKRHNSLRATVGKDTLDTEPRREEVRSAAVNFFVSLEDVLDRTLAFSVWAMMSDHFGVSRSERFRFNLSRARQVMADWIVRENEAQQGTSLELQANGKNNLYALIEGFRLAADLLEKAVRGELGSQERPVAEYPDFADISGIQRFVLRHKYAILDMDENAVNNAISLLRQTALTLKRTKLMEIRNRIPHAGGTFPSKDEFQSMLSAVELTIVALEDAGASPLVCHVSESVGDSYGREYSEVADYRGKRTRLYMPREMSRSGLPSTTTPQVIFVSALLRDSAEVLRFSVEEDSEYARMWSNYPRRNISAASEAEAVVELESLEDGDERVADV